MACAQTRDVAHMTFGCDTTAQSSDSARIATTHGAPIQRYYCHPPWSERRNNNGHFGAAAMSLGRRKSSPPPTPTRVPAGQVTIHTYTPPGLATLMHHSTRVSTMRGGVYSWVSHLPCVKLFAGLELHQDSTTTLANDDRHLLALQSSATILLHQAHFKF